MVTRDQLRTTLVNDSRLRCPESITPLKSILTFLHLPKVLFFSVSGHEIAINKSIKVRTSGGVKIFHMKGIIYHGGFHFTSRIIKQNGTVWFHDGQMGRECILEKHVKHFKTIELSNCNEREACLVVYTQNE